MLEEVFVSLENVVIICSICNQSLCENWKSRFVQHVFRFCYISQHQRKQVVWVFYMVGRQQVHQFSEISICSLVFSKIAVWVSLCTVSIRSFQPSLKVNFHSNKGQTLHASHLQKLYRESRSSLRKRLLISKKLGQSRCD